MNRPKPTAVLIMLVFVTGACTKGDEGDEDDMTIQLKRPGASSDSANDGGFFDSSGGAGRGHSGTIDETDNNGQGVELINISVDSKDSQVITVHLEPNLETERASAAKPPIVGTITIDAAYAIVMWGSAGFQSIAEIDIGSGTTFQIACSSLRVIAHRRLWHTVAGKNEMTVGGFAGYRGVGISKAPQCTRALLVGAVVIAPAGALGFGVPAFAKSFRAYILPSTNAYQIQVDGQASEAFTVDVAAGGVAPEIGLPGDAQVVWINNTGIGNIVAARLIFDLNM